MNTQQFYTDFLTAKNELSHLISSAVTPEGVEQCNKKITELSARCRNSRDFLPAHDLQSYQVEINKLSNELKHKGTEKKSKFKFKRAGAIATVPQTRMSQHLNHEMEPPSDMSEINVKDIAAQLILVERPDGRKLRVSNIERSIVLVKDSYSSCSLETLNNTVIWFQEPIPGPLYIQGAKNTTVICSCHQLRVHQSSNCQILVSCKTPIIENCENIEFGDYPTYFNGDGVTWTSISDFNQVESANKMNWKDIRGREKDYQWLLEMPSKAQLLTPSMKTHLPSK